MLSLWCSKKAFREESRYYLILAQDLGYGDTSKPTTSLEEVSRLGALLIAMLSIDSRIVRVAPIVRGTAYKDSGKREDKTQEGFLAAQTPFGMTWRSAGGKVKAEGGRYKGNPGRQNPGRRGRLAKREADC
jgi:hypothetical protein